MASILKNYIIIINFVAIVIFFYKIYKKIFEHLFAAKFIKNGFFNSLSTYFKTIEIDS